MSFSDLSAPALVSWQLTRDCDLACLHCCTDSAPGRALPGELSREQALRLAGEIAAAEVPYVMLCGGEPTRVPHFLELAQTLGKAGVWLKLETNGQSMNGAVADQLARLPIRSVQVSIDGSSQEVYGRMRPGGSLSKALEACSLTLERGIPLEITFCPTRLNIHQAEAVIDLSLDAGAFRFNSGRLMRLGTAAKLWERLELSEAAWVEYFELLQLKEAEQAGRLELCFRPFSLGEAALGGKPSATLLVLPDGRVKVSAALPYICADLKQVSLARAWESYQRAWLNPAVADAFVGLRGVPSRLQRANEFMDLPAALMVGVKESQ